MQPKIVVVGGGIAGLCAGVAFARRGCTVNIFESSKTLEDVGAGLQLSPNVTRLLQQLALGDRLEAKMVEPPKLSLVSGRNLQPICEVPAGEFARQRWHAPYGLVHRADLQSLLAETVRDSTSCHLHLGRNIAGKQAEINDRLTKEIGGEPDLVIAADGVWSGIRDGAAGAGSARFSGSIAWRGVADPKDCTAIHTPGHVNAFLGPATHLVTYPLGHRASINFVAVTPGAKSARGWNNSGDSESLQTLFAGWNREIVSMLERISWQSWPLYEVRDTCFRAGSKTVLIGDAAHAMTPHAAQGAAMAIEDACALAACFEKAGGDVEKTLAAFTALRTPRIARVRRRGDFNKFVYHARGPFRLGRNLVLRFRAPQKLAADLDWLYGYNATDVSGVF